MFMQQKIKRLADYSHQCYSIMTKALSSEFIYTEELSTDVLGAISNIKDLSTSMEKTVERRFAKFVKVT